MPLQSVCIVGKFFGGKWINGCGSMYGHKFVCLDKLYNDAKNGDCLIYSFGIVHVDDEWTFEEAMSDLGCTVRAFDPTIDGSNKPKSKKVEKFFYSKLLFPRKLF